MEEVNQHQHQHANDEEDAVLATLQASLHDQSVYEESVIRQATHALAPPLPTLGLPSLEGLHPAASATHVYDLLSKVRQTQEQPPRKTTAGPPEASAADLAYLKEQLLLAYLERVAGVIPEGSLVHEERRQARRQERLQHPDLKPAAAPTVTVPAAVARQAKRRKVQRITNDEEDPVQREAQQRQVVLARRQARRARKEERRLAQQDTYNDDEEEEEEAEWNNDSSSVPAEEDGLSPEAVGDAAPINTAASVPPLTCPLCRASVETTSADPVARDSLLAEHMQSCQQPGRRSRRGTAAAAPKGSIPAAVAVPQTRRRAASQKTGVAKRMAVPRTPKVGPPPLDDFEEWAYEDRVDDWIEYGLSRMKEMKERVDDGVAAAVGDDGLWQDYGEGLWVPAWVHRRLFGYQREGLKWMWGLQLQGCGGCLGDEVRGKVLLCWERFCLPCYLSHVLHVSSKDGAGQDRVSVFLSGNPGRQSKAQICFDCGTRNYASALVKGVGGLGSWTATNIVAYFRGVGRKLTCRIASALAGSVQMARPIPEGSLVRGH
jgi:hypothetical protein